ncbi:MAG TPA: NRDE family protein [Bacteroidia bacterium]|nr:NRDE family protein [Bacteroidia bacterium]
MCTVTFLPANSGFVLTSNRDESPARAALTSPPGVYKLLTGTAFFPKDAQGGTWFAAASTGQIHCLLNGAFKKHQHTPPYRKSRGIVLLESLQYNRPEIFAESYNFDGIEPFTMIMVEPAESLELFEFRWDGLSPALKSIDPHLPHIWSSVTLYDEQAQKMRQKVFDDWLMSDAGSESIFDLHKHGGYGDPENDFRMNRNGMVSTVSITQVTDTPQQSTMKYQDLLTGLTEELQLY